MRTALCPAPNYVCQKRRVQVDRHVIDNFCSGYAIDPVCSPPAVTSFMHHPVYFLMDSL